MMINKGASELRLVRSAVGLVEHSIRVGTSRNGALQVRLAVPRCQDALLDLYIAEEELMGFRTPYYGIVWPSAMGLARAVGSHVAEGDRIIELGCGLGLGGIAAAVRARPSSVLLTDYDPAAARLGRLNARLSGVASRVRSATLDWTSLEEWPVAAFDLAIAADIIYEEEACAKVAAVLSRTLRPGGRFLLADGERRMHRARLREHLARDNAFVPCGDETHMQVEHFGDSTRESNVVIAAWERTISSDDGT